MRCHLYVYILDALGRIYNQEFSFPIITFFPLRVDVTITYFSYSEVKVIRLLASNYRFISSLIQSLLGITTIRYYSQKFTKR
ncbi:hypothetical protein F4820DRAFT_411367 [Hypoxylon rubiginosum]|uniref:Uncharacterized protein n=1 Tax=Hypoxylon rubiginosum TaxID=110542 RepID=A0ACB9ZA76_9PEZI|nr:hypothetical protein F4820DRAFT_411367 [Hypoxylon rubiginosum]